MTLNGLEEGGIDALEVLVGLWDAVAVEVAVAVDVAVEVAVAVGELVADGPLKSSSRLTMTVAPPGTSKCHPSSHGGTTPSQLPVVLKAAAVIGVGVFGSSPI